MTGLNYQTIERALLRVETGMTTKMDAAVLRRAIIILSTSGGVRRTLGVNTVNREYPPIIAQYVGLSHVVFPMESHALCGTRVAKTWKVMSDKAEITCSVCRNKMNKINLKKMAKSA